MKSLIIGSCVIDAYIQLPYLPSLGEDVNSKDLRLSLGGMAYNVYHAIKLFGREPILGCPVGEGMRADVVTSLLEKQNDKPIGVIHGQDNGMCFCLVDDSRERSFISHHGAEYRFDPSLFESLNFDEIDWIYISGLEVEDVDGEKIVEFIETKKKNLFFAPGPRVHFVPKDLMERLLDVHPVLHINEREAALLAGKEDLMENIEILCKRTNNAVIITLGEKGALLKEPNKEPKLIPTKKVPMVDATGAGDNHAGSVLAGISEGMSFEEAIKRANYISGYAVQQAGAVITEENFNKAIADWKTSK